MNFRGRPPIRNRGTADNPANRFAPIEYAVDGDFLDQSLIDPELSETVAPSPRTIFLRDTSRSLITYNNSPDLPFDASLNAYRGCEHGCIYCYARPTHEFLGFSSGLDFETRILVKENAPELLRRELASSKWRPQLLAMSGVTDPYQPFEGRLQLTRRCLKILAEFRNPVEIVTKNPLVRRDIDVLRELARFDACTVNISITTLRNDLHRVLEPRTPQPQRRLAAIEELAEAGIAVGVMVAPIIPGLTDHELTDIVDAAAAAGARDAHYVVLRLPHAVHDLFVDWLEQHFPDRKDKVLNRIRDVRSGRLNDTQFGRRMAGEGVFAEQIGRLFTLAVKKAGLEQFDAKLSTEHFRNPSGRQLTIFDEDAGS
ncbi:MAG: PA0069 family radical SAM protein [Planctomycetes bacterium]|nr:PA0069 family radical SAM protein [Planctomycetota bacterium]